MVLISFLYLVTLTIAPRQSGKHVPCGVKSKCGKYERYFNFSSQPSGAREGLAGARALTKKTVEEEEGCVYL